TTLSTIAHCSCAAPGGVSQRVVQPPCLSLTTPSASGPAAKAWEAANSRPTTRLRSAQPAFDRLASVSAVVRKGNPFCLSMEKRKGQEGRAVSRLWPKTSAEQEAGDGGR